MSNRMSVAAPLALLVCTLSGFLIFKHELPGNSQIGAMTAAADERPKPKAPVAAKSTGEKPLFDGWKAPAAVILFSGEMHGYIEPCGCSVNQLGGLSRRADLMRQIRGRGWPATAFDVGGLVNNPTRQQAKLKFDMILKSLAEMQYAGVAMGVEELQLSFDFLTRPKEPHFLSSNLELFGEPTIEGSPDLKRVVQVGKIKIGVTAFFGLSLKEQVAPGTQEGVAADFKVLEPVAAQIKKALAELAIEKPDLLLLLSHAKYDETTKLAAAFPQFDIIVTAGGPEDPDPRPTYIGPQKKTLLVAPGQKGKHAPVVGYFPGADQNRLKYELVDLDDKRFHDAPKIVENMRYYQEDLLKERNLVANEPAIDDPRPTPSPVNPFVGSKVCGECHKSAYEIWESTPHAHASESLKKGPKGQTGEYISRMFDPECVACHVTGWDPKRFVRYKDGFTGEKTTPHLTGQGCENCHGPGGRHTDLERQYARDKKTTEELAAWRKYHKLSKKTAFDLCAKCHDGDNDPKFNSDTFDEYWKKIVHDGKD